MKILNFGACNIDLVYKLSHIVAPGETASAKSVSRFPGGKGLNQSIAIARSGAKVYHAGYLGNDGDFLKKILSESGVDITYLKTVNEPNGHAIIQVDDKGENSIIIHHGSNGIISTEFIDEVISHFEKDDILVVQNEINNLEYLVNTASAKGMKIVLNPSPITDTVKKIDLKKIWILILNQLEGKELSKETETKSITKYFRETYPDLKIVLTLGANGSMYFDKELECYCPSFEVDAVDTTGAGDTFTGYFVSGIQSGKKIEDALKYASAASALAISKEGAAVSIPEMDDVKFAIKHLVPKSDKNKFESECLQKTVLNYVSQNVANANLTELAQLLGYTAEHASSRIKKETGKTFSEILQDTRCDVAAKLLKETDMPIKEIIHEVGYENEGFLRKKFLQRYNMSFKEYRNR